LHFDLHEARCSHLKKLSKIRGPLHSNALVNVDNGGHWKGLDDLDIATCARVPWSNEERLHGELDYRTPDEVEEGYRVKSQTKVA
jgi:transposase InsO family protein